MIIPEKLKLNKFRHVLIPRGRDYFLRYGAGNTPNSALSGDDEPVPLSTKLEELDRLYRLYAKEMDKDASD